jgi:hypothetical protein
VATCCLGSAVAAQRRRRRQATSYQTQTSLIITVAVAQAPPFVAFLPLAFCLAKTMLATGRIQASSCCETKILSFFPSGSSWRPPAAAVATKGGRWRASTRQAGQTVYKHGIAIVVAASDQCPGRWAAASFAWSFTFGRRAAFWRLAFAICRLSFVVCRLLLAGVQQRPAHNGRHLFERRSARPALRPAALVL